MAQGRACAALPLSPRCPLVATIYLPAVNTPLRFNVMPGLILCCPQLSWHAYCIKLSTKRDEMSGLLEGISTVRWRNPVSKRRGSWKCCQPSGLLGTVVRNVRGRWSLKCTIAKLVLNRRVWEWKKFLVWKNGGGWCFRTVGCYMSAWIMLPPFRQELEKMLSNIFIKACADCVTAHVEWNMYRYGIMSMLFHAPGKE